MSGEIQVEGQRVELCPHCGVCLIVTADGIHWSESGECNPPMQEQLARLTAELQQADDARVVANRANAELRAENERMKRGIEVAYERCEAFVSLEERPRIRALIYGIARPLGRALNRPECGETAT